MKSLEIKDSPMATQMNEAKYYPSLSISTKVIPELANMKDGDTCTIMLQVKKTGSNSSNNDTRVHLDAIAGEYADDPETEDNPQEEQNEY